MILGGILGTIGAGITVIQKLYTIICGRLIYGFACGLLSVAMPRVIEETIPDKYLGVFRGLYCCSFVLANLIANFVSVFLPPEQCTLLLAESPIT